MVRAYCAKLLGMEQSDIRVMPSEIGGGFGGKTLVYLEPLALALSRRSGRPVRMVMNREDVFRATGPTSGGVVEVKLGATKDGRIVAAECLLKFQAGAFPGSPVQRSEEHTSELQSLMRIPYAVFCLKKKQNTDHTY